MPYILEGMVSDKHLFEDHVKLILYVYLFIPPIVKCTICSQSPGGYETDGSQ